MNVCARCEFWVYGKTFGCVAMGSSVVYFKVQIALMTMTMTILFSIMRPSSGYKEVI